MSRDEAGLLLRRNPMPSISTFRSIVRQVVSWATSRPLGPNLCPVIVNITLFDRLHLGASCEHCWRSAHYFFLFLSLTGHAG